MRRRLVATLRRWLTRRHGHVVQEGETTQPGWNYINTHTRRTYVWHGTQLMVGWVFEDRTGSAEFRWFTRRTCGCWGEGMGGGRCLNHYTEHTPQRGRNYSRA